MILTNLQEFQEYITQAKDIPAKKEKKKTEAVQSKVPTVGQSSHSKEDSNINSTSNSSGQITTNRSSGGTDSKLSNHTRIRNKVN
jgi:hypothetical protein